MKKDPKIFIEHILQSIEIIEGHIENKTEKDFLDSVLLQDAIIRRIEIIGEAVKNLRFLTPEKSRFFDGS